MSVRSARQMLAARRPMASGPAHETLFGLASRTGMQSPALSSCDELGGPATLPSGEICIPDWALDLPADQLEAMLAHELAHVERRDPWWLVAAVTLEALFWVQPFNRLARHRLAGFAELHADARAAQLTRNGRSLASCLVRCAENMNTARMPVLAAAMARRDGALSERVQRLLTDSTQTGGIPMSKKILIISGAMVLATVLPSVTVNANQASAEGEFHFSIQREGGGGRTMNMSFIGDVMLLELKASGDFVFAPDDSGLASMGPGARVNIVHEKDDTKRKLLAERTGDGIEYSYFVNEEKWPYDADAQAWLTGILPLILRESAINAPERVDYMLANLGHDGVLSEIARIRSDFARRRYVEAYVATGDLPDSAHERLVDEAARMDSDFELRKALTTIHTMQSPRGEQLTRMIEVAQQINSDFELRQFLEAIAVDAAGDRKVMAAYGSAAEGISSDLELRQALLALVEAGGGTDVVATAMPLAKTIGSDFELRQVLESAASLAVQDEATSLAWLEAATTISSDFEKRQALEEFVKRDLPTSTVWVALFETVKGIDSDHECASFLVNAVKFIPDDPAVETAFRSVMKTIASDHDYQRVATHIGG